MKYTIYDPTSGQILSSIIISNDQSFQDNLLDKHYVEGIYSDQDHYVDILTKTVKIKPPMPSNLHIWNITTKSWQVDIDQIRTQRNILLSAVDRVNPVWYNSLTQQQQTELQTYRQALLDVPQQASFPNAISWPQKPLWL